MRGKHKKSKLKEGSEETKEKMKNMWQKKTKPGIETGGRKRFKANRKAAQEYTNAPNTMQKISIRKNPGRSGGRTRQRAQHTSASKQRERAVEGTEVQTIRMKVTQKTTKRTKRGAEALRNKRAGKNQRRRNKVYTKVKKDKGKKDGSVKKKDINHASKTMELKKGGGEKVRLSAGSKQ